VLLSFGEWRPDVAGLDSQFVAKARNVYPGANSYKPIPTFRRFSQSLWLPHDCRGLTYARSSTGGWVLFAGSASDLFKYESGAWTNVTRSSGGDYAVPAGQYWDFRQFGTRLIACNSVDAKQVIDVDSGTEFEALAGSPPDSHLVAIVRDHVVAVGLSTELNKIHWSGTNDSEEWTVGTANSDTQAFPDGGAVMGLFEIGGDASIVLQETCIQRMTYLPGNSLTFRFDKIEDEKGAVSRYGAICVKGVVFFLSDDGFYSVGAEGLSPIGAQKVNNWFLSVANPVRLGEVLAIFDPTAPRVVWAFHSNDAGADFDRLIIHDWSLNRWSYAEITAQFWASVASPGITLEDLDAYGSIEDVPLSLDSGVWQGSRPLLGGLDAARRLAFLNGDTNFAATLETVEIHPIPGRRAYVNQAYPLIDGAENLTIRAGVRERLQNDVSYTAASSLNVTGACPMRASGRLHRYEVTIPEGETWTHAQGVVITPLDDGAR
jgi:hypothetical protein